MGCARVAVLHTPYRAGLGKTGVRYGLRTQDCHSEESQIPEQRSRYGRVGAEGAARWVRGCAGAAVAPWGPGRGGAAGRGAERRLEVGVGSARVAAVPGARRRARAAPAAAPPPAQKHRRLQLRAYTKATASMFLIPSVS